MRYEHSMTPSFYPELINDRFGDPGLYVDLKYEKRALLFDLGDLHALPARKILRVSDIFLSHAHLDHFIGFDQVLRVLLGRDKHVRIFGPAGTIDRVEHKLAGYSWNLLDRYTADLEFSVMDVSENRESPIAVFRSRDRFRRSGSQRATRTSGILLDEDGFQVRTAVLDHGIPCLAFAIQERAHINVWKTGLEQLGLPVGPWLRELKRAVMLGCPEGTRIRVPRHRTAESDTQEFSLGDLKDAAIRVTRGQKIAYVVDTLYSSQNKRRIIELASEADTLFIEATFTRDEADRAADRRHLTTEQAGHLARAANARQVVPFHFSPRHNGDEARLVREVDEAFRGGHANAEVATGR